MRRDGAANRDRILLAAEQVFGAGGASASTEEVARQAGVGVATIFRHFPTKKDLIEATAVRYLRGLEDDARGLAEHDDPGAAFAAVMRLLVSSGPTKVTLLTLLLTDDDGLPDSIVTAVGDFRGAVGVVLDRAQRAEAARPDTTVEDVFTLVRALAHVATPEHSEGVDRAVRIVLDGLGVRS